MRNSAMQLVDGRQLPLTPAEQRLYKLLPPRGRKTDTEKLAEQYFNNKIPFHGRIIISGMIRSMQRKGYVGRGERTGPVAMKVWKV